MHQIVILVYIPEFEGCFKDNFVILKYSLGPLFKTSHKKNYFSIINKGSYKEVVSYSSDLLEKGQIHDSVYTNNIVKLNAVLKGVSNHNFQIAFVLANAGIRNWNNIFSKN